MFVFYVYFTKNVAYFLFNSWLSFQRLCRFMGIIIVFKIMRVAFQLNIIDIGHNLTKLVQNLQR